MTDALETGWADMAAGDDGRRAGLRDYVALVAASLGIGLESCSIDQHPPMSAYVALDLALVGYPRREVALLWDERHGWSACAETHSGEDLIVVRYRGGDVLPPPTAVQAFVEALVAGLPVGQIGPPVLTGVPGESLAQRLRHYAEEL
ncbi:MAG TPA: DUF6292 family protein [Pseudonocardiaceae bacterium]|nr:DUF6292 family protein [Pseudonocardiaceae bacterium]